MPPSARCRKRIAPTFAFMMEYLPQMVLLAVRFQLIFVSKLSLVETLRAIAS